MIDSPFSYAAQEFLSSNALAFVHSSLGSTYNETLAAVARADSLKYTSGYTWSAPLHFVDAEDSLARAPATNCQSACNNYPWA